MPARIEKISNIAQISTLAYAMNGNYVYRFSTHKQMSHKIIVRYIWRSGNECQVSKMVKSTHIQVIQLFFFLNSI